METGYIQFLTVRRQGVVLICTASHIVAHLLTALPEPGLLGGIGSGEIIIIMIVLLILFGPRQLPDLAKTVGKALKGVRKAGDDLREEIGLDDVIDNGPRRRTRYSSPAARPPSPEEEEERERPGAAAEVSGETAAAEVSGETAAAEVSGETAAAEVSGEKGEAGEVRSTRPAAEPETDSETSKNE